MSERGRPRDPELEPKVYAAVLTVYAAGGWSGFTLDAVARQAGVGRAALYRRWSSKAELLAQTVSAYAPTLPRIDTGSSRADLAALAEHFLAAYRAPEGVVGLRMVLDARAVPELAEQFTAMLHGTRRTQVRAVVARAVARGSLPIGTSVDSVVEVITGATLAHVLFSQGGSDERHVSRLVALLLGG